MPILHCEGAQQCGAPQGVCRRMFRGNSWCRFRFTETWLAAGRRRRQQGCSLLHGCLSWVGNHSSTKDGSTVHRNAEGTFVRPDGTATQLVLDLDCHSCQRIEKHFFLFSLDFFHFCLLGLFYIFWFFTFFLHILKFVKIFPHFFL